MDVNDYSIILVGIHNQITFQPGKRKHTVQIMEIKIPIINLQFKMSNKLQTDIFQVLNTDHGLYLKPYDASCRLSIQDEYRTLEKAVGCRDLAKRIHEICNLYAINNYRTEEDTVRKSAVIIQHFFLSARNRYIFKELKKTLFALRKKDPVSLLKLVNFCHSEIFEKNSFRLIFRLDGRTFPPKIVYKFFPDQNKIKLINLRSWLGNKIIHENLGHSRWYNFKIYKCSVCKTTVKIKPKTKIKQKKKMIENNYISWIQEKYGQSLQ